MALYETKHYTCDRCDHKWEGEMSECKDGNYGMGTINFVSKHNKRNGPGFSSWGCSRADDPLHLCGNCITEFEKWIKWDKFVPTK